MHFHRSLRDIIYPREPSITYLVSVDVFAIYCTCWLFDVFPVESPLLWLSYLFEQFCPLELLLQNFTHEQSLGVYQYTGYPVGARCRKLQGHM